jgi:hypothetical protein
MVDYKPNIDESMDFQARLVRSNIEVDTVAAAVVVFVDNIELVERI